jgi:uncharacterized lipoprotein
MALLRVPFLMACATLAACSTNNYCLVEQDYQKAESVPELRSADGLAMPDSPSALRLPPAPASTVPFGFKGEEGGVCLDQPPTVGLPSKAGAEVVGPKS